MMILGLIWMLILCYQVGILPAHDYVREFAVCGDWLD